MAVKPIPEGFHAITPYFVCNGVPKLIEFLKKAFDGKEIYRHNRPDGAVMHAQVRIADSMVMMGEAMEGFPAMPLTIYHYVTDTDSTYKKALAAGATSIMAPVNQFYGDRSAGVKDPVGNTWWIGTHVEDVPSGEMAKRAEEAMKKRGQA